MKKLTPEQVERGFEAFLDLAARAGLSPRRPEDGWKMVFEMFPAPEDGWKVAFGLFMGELEDIVRNKSGSGVKAHKGFEDAILMIGMEHARSKGDRRSETEIIADLAEQFGWPAHEKAIESRRRRYQDLKKQDPEKSREFKNMLTVWPLVGSRLAELAARKK